MVEPGPVHTLDGLMAVNNLEHLTDERTVFLCSVLHTHTRKMTELLRRDWMEPKMLHSRVSICVRVCECVFVISTRLNLPTLSHSGLVVPSGRVGMTLVVT